MTNERMIELSLLLLMVMNGPNPETLNIQKMMDRVNELTQEFLEPYVIDNPEKSE